MTTLLTHEYGEAVKTVVRSATAEIAIVSAFSSLGASEAVLRCVAPSVRRKELHVRWCAEDLLCGISDLGVYELCKEHGFAMFMQPTLHAKFLIADRKHVLLGSANMTGRGFGFHSHSNVEAGVVTEPTADEIRVLEEIMAQSVLITPDLFDRIRSFVKRNRRPSAADREFPLDITSALEDHATGLWVRDLPLHFYPPSRGGRRDSVWDVELERDFTNSKCLRWLDSLLQAPDHGIYFGELTSSLHDALLEDPTPYRTEVKKLVANLINWCELLLPERYGSETPNHSQRLYMKTSTVRA
jgi:hypothetical protein